MYEWKWCLGGTSGYQRADLIMPLGGVVWVRECVHGAMDMERSTMHYDAAA